MNNLLDETLATLKFALDNRDDFFLTTSFGYQSSLLLFLFSEIAYVPKCLFVKSKLSGGGIERQIEYLTNRFRIDLFIVDRDDWLEQQLCGREFLDLEETERKKICRSVKRDPLLEFIKLHSLRVWVSGIRKDQTESRDEVKFMEVTDLGVIKLSPLCNWSKTDVEYLLNSNNLQANLDYFDLCKLNDTKECGLHY
jgi:phosphoadenosine phosphosulfate reductase